MRTNQTLDEARKYLLYVSDALHAVAKAYSTDKHDREVLEKYATDLFDYSTGLEQLKLNITSREQSKKKLEMVAELESTYQSYKSINVKAQENLHIVKARLKQAIEAGIEKEIEEAKQRVEYYTKRHTTALYNEMVAKRDLELGA
jgi:hypothetical protein